MERRHDIPANRVVLLRDHEAQAISAAAGSGGKGSDQSSAI
jgi:hypothetical protein